MARTPAQHTRDLRNNQRIDAIAPLCPKRCPEHKIACNVRGPHRDHRCNGGSTDLLGGIVVRGHGWEAA